MTNELRALVDQYGIFAVIDALSSICGQNAETAKSFFAKDDWQAAETALDAAASKVLDLFEENPAE